MATCWANVTTIHQLITWLITMRWLSAACRGGVNAILSASTKNGFVHHDSTRRAIAQVAEVLTRVVATGQWTAAHLQANVCLVVAIIEAFTAHLVTLVVPAGLLGATDLVAHHIANF